MFNKYFKEQELNPNFTGVGKTNYVGFYNLKSLSLTLIHNLILELQQEEKWRKLDQQIL